MDPETLAQLYGNAFNDPMPVEEAGSVQDTTVAPYEPDMWDKLAQAAGYGLQGLSSLGTPSAASAGSGSVSGAVGASYSGLNQSTFNKLQRKGGYEAGVAADRQREMDRAAALSAQYEGAATDEQKAIEEEGQAQKDYFEAKRTGQLDLATLNNDYAREEQKAVEMARAEAEESKADFASSMAELRSMRVRPSQLFDNMTSGERFGSNLAVFVTDFIAASQGVKSSATDILMKAVDRNIDSQISNINQATEVTKMLWEQARSKSATLTEAKLRMRAYALQSVMDEAEGNMARYEGGLATAKAKAAKARLHTELVKTVQGVYEHADKNAFESQRLRLEKRGQDLRAAAERRAYNARMAEIEASKNAKKVEQRPQLIDTSESGQNQIARVFKPWTTTKQQEELQDLMDTTSANVKTLRELAQWRRDNPPPSGPGVLAADLVGWRSEAERYYRAALGDVQDQLLRSRSGAAASEKEMDRLRSILPLETFFTRGDQDQVYSGFIDRRINDVNIRANQLTDDPEGTNAPANLLSGEKVEARAIIEGRTGERKDDVSKWIGNINEKGGRAIAKEPTPEAKKDWETYTDSSGSYSDDPAEVAGGGYQERPGQPVWAVNMSKLKDEARDYIKDPENPDKKDRGLRALSELARWASTTPEGFASQGETAEKESYARLMLSQLGLDPMSYEDTKTAIGELAK